MRELVAIVAHGTHETVERIVRVWDEGDAFLPIDPRLPAAAVDQLLATMRPAAVIDAAGHRSPRSAADHPDGLPPVPVLEGDAVVVATSGSTGTPKGVVHTHGSVAASAHATNAGVGTDPERDTWLCSLPLAHVAGLSVVFRSVLSGTRLLLLDGFDARACEAAATEQGATLTTLVPTALARIDPSLFRRIVVGGTHPPAVLPPNCVVSYGLSETGSAVAYDGRPLDGAELAVVDGTVRVRGPMLLRAYRTADPEGLDPKDAAGWFDTHDAGSLDAAGVLHVHGRVGDLIISGGENVWPIAVEHALAGAAGVAEVAVVGRPDPDWGQVVTAVVVPADPSAPPTLDALRARAKATLPAFAAPRRLELVDRLPTTALGKVQRHQI